MINLHTKLEVAMLIHYEGMKGNVKCRNWDGLEWLAVTQGHRQHNNSIERIRLRF